MASYLSKYARTRKSFIIFSNCINHLDAFNQFYKNKIKMKEFGYIRVINKNNEIKLDLIPEGAYCDLEQKKDREVVEYFSLESSFQNVRYILTSSRFIIFSNKISYKKVANRLFMGFIIQGAGEVSFKSENGKATLICFGEAKDLNIKSRPQDAAILKEALEIEF